MVADASARRNRARDHPPQRIRRAAGVRACAAYAVGVPNTPRTAGRTRRWITRACAALLVVAATGCLPRAATAQGAEVAWLYNAFLVAAAAVFAVVAGLMAWSIIRYRGPAGADAPPPRQVHGNVALEIVWWAIPTGLVAVLVVLTAMVLAQVDGQADDPEVTVGVEGFQWGWRFTYEEDGVVVAGTAENPPTIHLPVDRPIAFVIRSEDVIHSFSIPEFLIKRDAVPGQENRFDVVIEHEGTYTGQCGEFCGLLHSRQLFTIEAVQGDAFEAWLDEQAAASR
jgi:cytochrome c oxidase subunit II